MTIVTEDEPLIEHLSKELKDLNVFVKAGGIWKSTYKALRRYDKITSKNFLLPALPYFFLSHHLGDRSLRELAKECRSLTDDIGISYDTLGHLFELLRWPKLTREESHSRKVHDPRYIEIAKEAGRTYGLLRGVRQSADSKN